jgi:FtsP/CotA-like multicopper oxidase with cupredoxin domain
MRDAEARGKALRRNKMVLSRRTTLLGGLTAAAVLAQRSVAQTTPAQPKPTATDPVTILRVQRRNIEVNGKAASVLGISQPDGTQGIVTAVGKQFRVRLENQLDVPTLIHWHGMAPPWQQDGVPGISGPPIQPGATADYDFPLRFGGTFWMHSHEGLQEQELLAAPLIIHDDRDRPGQQEVVVMLADFSFTPPEQIFEALRKSPGMPGIAGAKPAAMAGMNMGAPTAAAPDLNDVTYDAFLANDRTLADPDVVRVEPGGTILLRVINSSSMSSYHLDLGALQGELIAVDGFRVQPITGKRFPISVAQRLDIRIKIPSAPAAHPVLAILEGERDQTGVILQAGLAQVSRVVSTAAMASPAVTLDLERRLRAAEPLKPRKADRVHQINLTGQMAGYVWSLNGVVWNKDVAPLPIAQGERVELVFENKTPMPHPMHLHGHEFQVVEINGQRFSGAVRDTIQVPPVTRVVVAFDANNPGWWAMHCHLLYHMDAGMFTTLRYV